MPVFRFPFFYNPNYYHNFTNSMRHNYTANSVSSFNQHNSKTINSNHATNNTTDNSSDLNKKNNSKSNDTPENYFFELFGLKLYFDDILLICLIFFLYQEGVKDDELFLSLILLLLT